MHDLTRVLFRVLVFEHLLKSLVRLSQERLCVVVLLARAERLRSGQPPRIRSVELRRVLVRAQVHVEGELVLGKLASFDQVVEIVRVADKINVHIGRRSYRLPALSAADDFLELGLGCLNLPPSVLNF